MVNSDHIPIPGSSGGSDTGTIAGTRKDGLARLLEKQLEEINAVSEKIDLWKKYKKDYEDLKKIIDQSQDKVRHPYRIPIAGYNYFALRSARQATKIIDRRLLDLQQRLKESEEAKKKAEDWMNATIEHRRDKEEYVEIIETM